MYSLDFTVTVPLLLTVAVGERERDLVAHRLHIGKVTVSFLQIRLLTEQLCNCFVTWVNM